MKDLEMTALILFLLIVASLFALIMKGLKAVPQSKKTLIFIGILAWLVILLLLGKTGFFSNFKAIPPHIAVALFPPIIVMIIIVSGKKLKPFLASTPVIWFIAPQVFRIFVELFLWMLYKAGIAPIQMTFEGRNLDILSGLSAPIIAYIYLKWKDKPWARIMAIVWNITGLVLLINIVSVAMLSTPSPIRIFMNEPANTFIGEAPYIWLPGFVVPCAYYLHALSLKQLLMKQKK